MINRVQLVRNIGQFDSVAVAPQLSLARLTLIYAENGRGKTTLAAILRSLASGDPLPIVSATLRSANPLAALTETDRSHNLSAVNRFLLPRACACRCLPSKEGREI